MYVRMSRPSAASLRGACVADGLRDVDLLAQRRQDELHREASRPVLDVEHWIDLHDVDGRQPLRLRDHLHREVRLAIRQAAVDGRADAGGETRVDAVDVEADVD